MKNMNFNYGCFYMIKNSFFDRCKFVYFKPFHLLRLHLSPLSPDTWCNARWVIWGAVMTPGYERCFQTWLTQKYTESWSAWVNEMIHYANNSFECKNWVPEYKKGPSPIFCQIELNMRHCCLYMDPSCVWRINLNSPRKCLKMSQWNLVWI